MNPPRNLTEVVRLLINLINPLIVVVAGLALLVFIWGLVKFIAESGDAKSHADGKKLMIWGVIALFVMVSFLGIIQFFYTDFFGPWPANNQFPTLQIDN
jgi:heme/copper-type cytochrome/quinol oxidase subunit 2